MASQEIIEKRIAILKLIKQELQKSETFLDIDNPSIDNSKIVKKAMKSLSYLHKMFGNELVKILQSEQKIKQSFLSKPKLSLENGTVVRSKHYKPVSQRESKELNTIHGAIQDYLCNDESNKKIYETIETEKQFIGLSYKIDILAKLKDEDRYDVFEVKSADTAEICIKEALGQLLFYKYLLEKGDYKINQLIIAGPSKITCIEEEYLNSLNSLIPELRYKYVPSIKY